MKKRGFTVVENTELALSDQDVAELDAARAELDVARLVRQAASGKQAWERLVDQYGRLLWSITREFRLVESDAADVVQTTWMRLIEHIDRLQHPERVGSWLAVTARNECLRNLAARRRFVLAHDDDTFDGPADYEPEVDEALLAEESAEVVGGDDPPAVAVAAPDGTADGGSPDLVR